VGRHQVEIQVRYPAGAGEILLRTERDWDRDVEPLAVSDGGSTAGFRVESDRPFVYFKPVLRSAGSLHWSAGGNRLAVAAQPNLAFPYFFEEPACSVCTLLDASGTARDDRFAFRVYLPPGYHENTLARYPVLYMQDGQNLFFPQEAFGGSHWRVQETLELLTSMNAVREAVVVGVYPQDRMRDYTRPGYREYGRFLVERLKPKIDATYRVLAGPEHTAAMGSSLGGVVSFFLAWEWPRTFGMAACLSSTFGYQDDLRERVLGEPRRPVRLYLDSGWPGDNYEATRDMRAVLLGRGFREGEDLLYLAFPEAMHNERDWALRSHIPYQFFFARRPPADRIE
jgi:predicted alpha/beta superfamily hydrolase